MTAFPGVDIATLGADWPSLSLHRGKRPGSRAFMTNHWLSSGASFSLLLHREDSSLKAKGRRWTHASFASIHADLSWSIL